MIQVSRNVVRDLLPVYLAGEASAETKALVEEFLRTDKELAEEARLASQIRLPSVERGSPDAEKDALEATRRLLKNRTATMAVAIVFTVLPFTFVFDSSGITFLLIRDAPLVGIAWWATAAIMWLWHGMIRRRLRVSNL